MPQLSGSLTYILNAVGLMKKLYNFDAWWTA